MAQNFVKVNGQHFELNGQPYYFLGTNFWYGLNLGVEGPDGDRARLLRELDRFQEMGITNLRIIAASEGPDTEPWRMTPALMPEPGVYNEAVFDGLDFLIAELSKRNIKAVLCLSNFWVWSGGMSQYVQWVTEKPIPYPDLENGGWTKYSFYTAKFYNLSKAKELYWEHLRQLITRENKYTGRSYKDEPAIMAWQLCNEPRGMLRPRIYRRWIRETAALIKSLDSNHLVSIGSEGKTPYPIGNKFRRDHSDPNIDYFTCHIWIQNWGWYDPMRPEETFDKGFKKAKTYLDKHLTIANRTGKPIVLEEFGIARDLDNHSADASTAWRDQYYTQIFDLIYQYAASGNAMAGGNFWAWGGEGRPSEPKAIWQHGDDFIGDPPHEYQGWYSVYEQDSATIEVIKKYTKLMNRL